MRERLSAYGTITSSRPEASFYKVRFSLNEFTFRVKMVAAEGIVNPILSGQCGRA
ncbi:MAG TPA: hypothetical protein PLD26_09615 [Smithella sp.]|nr:hypothetical protein [Smithella sp.]